MRIIEKILIALAAVALVFKISHYLGGGIMIVISLMMLSWLYMFLGFALFNGLGFRQLIKNESYKGIHAKQIIHAIAAGLAASVSLVGIVFKVQYWPGASFQLLDGIITGAIVLVITFVSFIKQRKPLHMRIFARLLPITLLSIIFYLTPTTLLFKIQRTSPEIQAQILADPAYH